ncbi:MAG: DUF6036 family nucleotidyltransferase [Planctomycetota bacterium]|jgi:hypothetical protein
MRDEMTRQRLRALMKEIARTAPRRKSFRVYLVGGGTAVHAGWRSSSIDADLFSDEESVFRDIQGIKERLNINVEFARPEHFVPALRDSASRHVFIETLGRVSYYHYDPYAQVLSKIVRGFERDLDDARHFVRAGMIDIQELRSLVEEIPDAEYAKYPNLSRMAVLQAVDEFLGEIS